MKTTKSEKKQPVFIIYVKDENGDLTRAGATFAHEKGDGFNISIGGKHWVAFPNKKKTEGESAA